MGDRGQTGGLAIATTSNVTNARKATLNPRANCVRSVRVSHGNFVKSEATRSIDWHSLPLDPSATPGARP